MRSSRSRNGGGGDDVSSDEPLVGGRRGGGSSSKSRDNASLRFLNGGGGSGGGIGFSEDTASSSSPALSLQLPFSEDEAALLNGLDQTFRLAGDAGVVGMAGSALGLAGMRTGGLLDELPADAARVRVLELREELAHLDRRRTALEAELRQERAR